MNRRSVLGSLTATALMSFAARPQTQQPGNARQMLFEPWQFGARGDGKALDSPAINKAIDACTNQGGGIVYLRPGTYRCGTVVLKSNVTLYVEAGATILGSLDLNDYTAMPGPPLKSDANQKHLMFARDAENVTLAGPGRIDGQGPHFWVPSGRTPLPEEEQWAEVAAHAWMKSPLGRPSPMLEFVGCRWLRVEGLRIENAAGWTMRPINCDNVFLHGLSIKNPNIGPNTDGMDITGCQNVFVSDCSIDTGDDCICLKSENPYGPEPRLGRNITVTNCTLTTCCNGFKLGTATQGGFENITFSNSVIYNNPGAYKDRVISGIALEIVDGGWIDGVVVTGIRMQRTRTPIFIRLGNRSQPHVYPQNGIRNITIADIEASEALLASSVTGIPGRTVHDVRISNVRVSNVLQPRPEWVGRKVPEQIEKYPEARMFGMLPVSGMYARHVRGLTLRDIHFSAPSDEPRPTILFDDVHDATISGFKTTPVSGSQPILDLRDSSDVWIRDTAAPNPTTAFLSVEDGASKNILVSGCDLRGATGTLVAGSVGSAVSFQNNITQKSYRPVMYLLHRVQEDV